ncbi:hypothetical protein HYC85_012846 [Camellia sinensis]|uniref:Uncharacterized protein n=1 Tax=Camellia sinensis TaxID=4442 RepID=A0A7J7HD51_CAMSI|nr:hypothetical protein HYC85_012846 [Camellia sinensis]
MSESVEFIYFEPSRILVKKASQVFYLHFALKRRAFIEEIHEKQEQVREWLQNLGIGDHTTVVQDDDEHDDETVPSHHDESTRSRDVPSSAALPIIRPALGRQHSISDRAKVAMQGYLNHFLSNIDIVNSREAKTLTADVMLQFTLASGAQFVFQSGEICYVFPVRSQGLGFSGAFCLFIFPSKRRLQGFSISDNGSLNGSQFSSTGGPIVCKFLEVSKLSFSPEYGPKLKEDYVMVKHLPKIPNNDDYRRCCACPWFSCCNDNWQKFLEPIWPNGLEARFRKTIAVTVTVVVARSWLRSVKAVA